ncbi:MAG: ATP/GTP-binding protein, partial [Actinomycetota bacterium]|nr:ATP/GTP-binding protein [Actinomycetota bacterium]
PVIGVPVGLHLITSAAVGCDPISWFTRAKIISNPSAFVLGLPGLGKSSLVRRMMLGLTFQGVIPLVLGDTKPDHVDLISALGGQVITLGPGRGALNVLDPGEAREAAEKLRKSGRDDLADRLTAESADLRLTMVASLITIARREPPTDREEAIVERALQLLDEQYRGTPVLGDLLNMIRSAPEELQLIAVSRGRLDRYQEITEGLEATLQGLIGSSRFGDVFSKPTSTPMMRDRPVVFDVSSVSENNQELQAAILLACWSYGFGTVRVAEALAEAGLEPRRHYFVVMDEIWKSLRVGHGLVQRIDALTRLNRQRGVGQIMITHTVSDLELTSTHETAMAKGFIERSAIVICGGLPDAEMAKLQSVVRFSKAEQDMVVAWKTPPGWDTDHHAADPPGMGKFLIKVGGRPGIPVQVVLTEAELAVNDTNKMWREKT